MKIFQWSAAVLAAALGAAVGCGSGGCMQPTNVNANTNTAPHVTCGPGTSNSNNVCVPTLPAH